MAKNYHNWIIISVVVMISWGGYLWLGPINDDYQIIGHHISSYASNPDILSPFYTQDISGIYYRPLPNTIHKITVSLSNSPIVAHRYINLFLYLVLCLSFYSMIKSQLRDDRLILFISLVFAVLTSHWYYVGWIAGVGDLLIAIFACIGLKHLSRLSNKPNGIDELIFYSTVTLSAISKEHGFMLALAPFAFLLCRRDKKRLLRLAVISIFIVVISLLISSAINTGNLADSSNLEGLSIISIIKNFLLAFPLAYFDFRYLVNGKAIVLLSIALLAILSLKLFIFQKTSLKNLTTNKEYIIYFLIAIFFLLPALPTLMPWYALYFSIPLLVASSILLQNMLGDYWFGYTRIEISLSLIIIIALMVYNISRSLDAQKASVFVHSVFNNSTELIEDKADSIVIIGYPERINGINTMVVGRQQFVQKMKGVELDTLPDIDSKIPQEIIFSDGYRSLAKEEKQENPNKSVYYFLEEAEKSRFVKVK